MTERGANTSDSRTPNCSERDGRRVNERKPVDISLCVCIHAHLCACVIGG